MDEEEKKAAEKKFMDIASAKEVLSDEGKEEVAAAVVKTNTSILNPSLASLYC